MECYRHRMEMRERESVYARNPYNLMPNIYVRDHETVIGPGCYDVKPMNIERAGGQPIETQIYTTIHPHRYRICIGEWRG